MPSKIGCPFRPLGTNVVIKPDPLPKDRNFAGSQLVMSEAHMHPPNTGTIVAVGDEVPEDKVRVQMRVLFSRFGGYDLECEGEKYKIFQLSELIAEVEDAEVIVDG